MHPFIPLAIIGGAFALAFGISSALKKPPPQPDKERAVKLHPPPPPVHEVTQIRAPRAPSSAREATTDDGQGAAPPETPAPPADPPAEPAKVAADPDVDFIKLRRVQPAAPAKVAADPEEG